MIFSVNNWTKITFGCAEFLSTAVSKRIINGEVKKTSCLIVFIFVLIKNLVVDSRQESSIQYKKSLRGFSPSPIENIL